MALDVTHELAILRPRRGDIVVLYVAEDLLREHAAVLYRELVESCLRAGNEGVTAFVLPRNATLKTLTAEELDRLGLRRK